MPQSTSPNLRDNRNKQGSHPKRVLMLVARAHISGPLPKIAPLQIQMLETQGYWVDVAHWGRRFEGESFARKFIAGPWDLLKVLRALGRRPYDILFVNTQHDAKTLLRDLPLLWSTRGRGVDRVLLMHGSYADRLAAPGSRLFKIASRLLAKQSDAILLLSTEESVMWAAFEPRGAYFNVVNPFVPGKELEEAAVRRQDLIRQDHRPPRVIFVGRLIREKGIADLLEAMKIVNKSLPCSLLVAGAGPLRDELAAFVHRNNLADKVEFRGYMSRGDLAEVYASADMLALPTYREGFPTVIAEAMSVGLPIITTRIRGAADLLVEGRNCLFVCPGDTAQLAGSILTLLRDEGLAWRISRANRDMAGTFTPGAVGETYARIFASLDGNRDHALLAPR